MGCVGGVVVKNEDLCPWTQTHLVQISGNRPLNPAFEQEPQEIQMHNEVQN